MKLFQIIIALLVGLSATLLYTTSFWDLTSFATEILPSYYNHFLNTLKTNPLFSSETVTRLLSRDSTINENQEPQQDNQHLFATNMSVPRAISKVVYAAEQAEGAGARIRRSIGSPNIRNFSPFLMLDHFHSTSTAGFPDHPHRGQETITYLINGRMDHEDFVGNRGTLNSGDLQFMTAGRGIVHAEMPRPNQDGSPNIGLQLWVDLPKELKYCEPRYRDLHAAEIPSVELDEGRATIKVISGQSHGVDSVKDLAYTPVWLLDVTLRPGAKVTQPLPQGWNAFSYVLEGEVYFGEGDKRQKVEKYNNVIFEQKGDIVQVEAESSARLVIVAGTPLDQPIVQYGPFVVSSKEEVYQAVFDYQSHSNGFERAKDWQSEISKPIKG